MNVAHLWKKQGVAPLRELLYMKIVFPLLTSPGGIFGQNCQTSNTRIRAKNGQKWTVENSGTTYLPTSGGGPPPTLNRKIIAVNFLRLFTQSDRFRDMAVES